MPAVIASVAVTVSAVKSAQLFITLYKTCQFVGLKKKEVTTIVCVFLRKAPTKKGKTGLESSERKGNKNKVRFEGGTYLCRSNRIKTAKRVEKFVGIEFEEARNHSPNPKNVDIKRKIDD